MKLLPIPKLIRSNFLVIICRAKKEAKSVIGPLENDVGELEPDDTIMSVLLNEYFCSVFTIENQDIPNPEDIVSAKQMEALTTVNFSPAEVIKYIDKLKVNKSPGPDQIGTCLAQMAPAPLNVKMPMLP
ncbi:hypothetical protein DMUE_5973 [Dictyocoela muelleri]|nr:hypothetical protein DMUE_5973 [Dictyocoela muelleri]